MLNKECCVLLVTRHVHVVYADTSMSGMPTHSCRVSRHTHVVHADILMSPVPTRTCRV